MVSSHLLCDLMELEDLEGNRFCGLSSHDGFKQIFGGQVVGQALSAAGRTVADDRHAHSLHAYFLRPGNASQPIIYHVDRVRDGASFSTRRVQAEQQGKVIFLMIASFHVLENGLEHQVMMPTVPPPEALRAGADLHREWLQSPRDRSPGMLGLHAAADRMGIEFRPVRAWGRPTGAISLPVQELWFRSKSAIPDGRHIQACVLAYASDFNLLGTTKLANGGHYGQTDVQVASIDHAVWFHREFNINDWLLYSMDSPSTQAARGFARGQIFDREGNLVASVTQEGLIRSIADR